MKRVFSAMAPSGTLHIGNYLGALSQWRDVQDSYDCIFSIADYHAMTVFQDPKKLQEKILEVAMIYLAAGIRPRRAIVFVQSEVLEHANLAWLFNTITKIPELELMTQFKDKAKRFRAKVNVGLFDYPVLMAADILLYHTQTVPVGEDQVQHLEFTRELARRFNTLYGEFFPIPQALVRKEGARIMGLDNPLRKMSKSAEHPDNYLALTDTPKIIQEKISRAVTDSGSEVVYNLKRKAGISNLLTIYSLVSGKTIEELEIEYEGKKYRVFKEDVAGAVNAFLTPFQDEFVRLRDDEVYVRTILSEGAERARVIARDTMKDVRKLTGLEY